MRRALSRRHFLAGGTGLVVGFTLVAKGWGARQSDQATAGPATRISDWQRLAWLQVAPDGSVTIFCATTELGQGAATPFLQVMADELDIPAQRVRVVDAPVTPPFIRKASNGKFYYVTWGSAASRVNFLVRRKAAAAARMMLVQAAAERWGVQTSECVTRQGVVVHVTSGRTFEYGALATDAAALPVPTEVTYRPRSDWRLIGRSVPRQDLPAKVDGSAKYGIDTILPDMLVATISQCPVFGGRLASVDPAPAMKIHGVKTVIAADDYCGVVASGFWEAKEGLATLKPVWNEGNNASRDSAEHSRTLRAALDRPVFTKTIEGADAAAVATRHDAAMASAARRIEAIFEAPFLAHAPMEPMNATARVTADSAELWLPTQYQSAVREEVARLLGLPPDRVVVNTTLTGGGFGRRTETDYALQAAEIARRVPGRPVKLVWSREEDISHGYFRPAAAARLTAGLHADGMPAAFGFTAACPSISDYSADARVHGNEGVDEGGLMYVSVMPYVLPAQLLRLAPTDLGVPVTVWRSVGSSFNCFFVESFIDEMAVAAKAEPLAYRRRLLATKPRELAVLEKAAALSRWDLPPSAGRFRGFAMNVDNGSVVAEVVELSVDSSRLITLHGVTCVVDCGIAINPDCVRAQMEGGIVFGLTAALFGEITLRRGAVEQRNFDSYRLLSLAQTPEIAVHILEGGDFVGGVGEEAVPPIAPAVANALFAATGARLRRLPFSRQGFSLA